MFPANSQGRDNSEISTFKPFETHNKPRLNSIMDKGGESIIEECLKEFQNECQREEVKVIKTNYAYLLMRDVYKNCIDAGGTSSSIHKFGREDTDNVTKKEQRQQQVLWLPRGTIESNQQNNMKSFADGLSATKERETRDAVVEKESERKSKQEVEERKFKGFNNAEQNKTISERKAQSEQIKVHKEAGGTINTELRKLTDQYNRMKDSIIERKSKESREHLYELNNLLETERRHQEYFKKAFVECTKK